MRSIAPPSGTSVRKNSICFSSKSIGVAQPPSALSSSLDEKDSGPKLIQSPVALCSRRAPANDHGGAVLAKIEAVRAVPLQNAIRRGGELFEKALDLGLEIASDQIGPGAAGRELAGEALDLGIELIGRRIGRDGGQRRGEPERQ